jgi:hypothetical protein
VSEYLTVNIRRRTDHGVIVLDGELDAANRCTAAGGWLRPGAPQRHLAWVLAVTGLLSALPTYRSVAGAAVGTGTQRITAEAEVV